MDPSGNLLPNNFSSFQDTMSQLEIDNVFSFGGSNDCLYPHIAESKKGSREYFINTHLMPFYEDIVEFANSIKDLSREHIMSIANEDDPNRKKIDSFLTDLTNRGFSGIRGRGRPDTSIAFWSGASAQNHLFHPHQFVSDLTVPAYTALVCAAKSMPKDSKIGKQFMDAIFTHYASHAFGRVYVFVSKPYESAHQEIFLTAHNYFWDVELPVLFKLKREGVVKEINVFFMGSPELLPQGLKATTEISSVASDNIKIVNRSSLLENKNCPMITLGQIRGIAQKWKQLAKKNEATV